MKRIFLLSCLTFLLLTCPVYSEDTLPFFEDILNTTHNMVPKGASPPSTYQACIICHTAEEVRSFLGPLSSTPPELAPLFESPSQTEGGSLKALWNSREGKRSYLPDPAASMKWDLSIACLSCHDGVIGNNVHGTRDQSGKLRDHPVNVPYPRESNGHFIPVLPLPNELRYWSIPNQNEKGIILPTGPTSEYYHPQTPVLAVRTSYGKVNCGSCHNPHTSKVPAYLRESPKTLCLVCHNR